MGTYSNLDISLLFLIILKKKKNKQKQKQKQKQNKKQNKTKHCFIIHMVMTTLLDSADDKLLSLLEAKWTITQNLNVEKIRSKVLTLLKKSAKFLQKKEISLASAVVSL